MNWTASINVYDNGERISYSVRMWRIGEARRTFRSPDVQWQGHLVRPLSQAPTAWLPQVARSIAQQTETGPGTGNS